MGLSNGVLNFQAAAQFPFSMANLHFRFRGGPFVFVELSFFEDFISLFAAEITEEESSSVSEPVGSGNLTCCSPLRFPTGFKYVKIDFDIAKITKAVCAITSKLMKQYE